MWFGMDQKPGNGRRVVFLYKDGGGAALIFIEPDGTWVDEHGSDDTGHRAEYFIAWAYLPTTYRLFFEREE